MVRRTKEQAAQTRLQLLDAAEKVFSKNGVTNTKLIEIAEAAGVTRGAFYWHFKNKSELVAALCERVELPLEEAMKAAEVGLEDQPLMAIKAKVVEVFRQVITDVHCRALFTILFHKCEYVNEVMPIQQRHISSRNECLINVVAELERAKTLGFVDKGVNSNQAAIGLYALIDGLIYHWLMDDQFFDLSLSSNIIDCYLRGLTIAGQQ